MIADEDFVVIAALTNGYTKLSVGDNDKKNHLKIDTLDRYTESGIC